MIHCTDADLIDYLHGELAPASDALVLGHLERCRDCTTRYEREAALGEHLRRAARRDERELPALVRARVWAAVHTQEPSLVDRLRAVLRPIVAIPALAAIAVAAFVAVPIVRDSTTVKPVPTVAATYYLEEHAAEGQENPLADHTSATFAEEHPATTATLTDSVDAGTLDDVAAR
jgi:anti-sigma factor RsiW